MKINLKKNEKLNENEFIIDLQYSLETQSLKHLIDYINDYELRYENKVIVQDDKYSLIEIKYNDIIMFYSDKKYNYCKTKNNTYRVKSKLYELEQINLDFVRISKCCIINIKHVEKFDISETGKIVVKLDNSTEAIVSRRKTSNIMKYLENRRI